MHAKTAGLVPPKLIFMGGSWLEFVLQKSVTLILLKVKIMARTHIKSLFVTLYIQRCWTQSSYQRCSYKGFVDAVTPTNRCSHTWTQTCEQCLQSASQNSGTGWHRWRELITELQMAQGRTTIRSETEAFSTAQRTLHPPHTQHTHPHTTHTHTHTHTHHTTEKHLSANKDR